MIQMYHLHGFSAFTKIHYSAYEKGPGFRRALTLPPNVKLITIPCRNVIGPLLATRPYRNKSRNGQHRLHSRD
jgi:hypothetical protein